MSTRKLEQFITFGILISGFSCCRSRTDATASNEPPSFVGRRGHILDTIKLANGGTMTGWAQETTPGVVLSVNSESVVLMEVHPGISPQLEDWINRPIRTESEVYALRAEIREAEYLAILDDVAPSIWILPDPSAHAEQIAWLIDSVAPPFLSHEVILWRTDGGGLAGTHVTDDQYHRSLAGAFRRLLIPRHPVDILYGGQVYDCRLPPDVPLGGSQTPPDVACSLVANADLTRPLSSVGICVTATQSWEDIVDRLSVHHTHISELYLLFSCVDPKGGTDSTVLPLERSTSIIGSPVPPG